MSGRAHERWGDYAQRRLRRSAADLQCRRGVQRVRAAAAARRCVMVRAVRHSAAPSGAGRAHAAQSEGPAARASQHSAARIPGRMSAPAPEPAAIESRLVFLRHRLATLRGIGEAYYDHRGELRSVTVATRDALLAAMGCQLHDAPAIEGTALASSLAEGERAEIGGEQLSRRLLVLPDAVPCGYHELCASVDALAPADCTLIVAPVRCFEPESLQSGLRSWGVAAQLYTLRSERNWGIGDFADLRELVERAAGCGADFVGINPLH